MSMGVAKVYVLQHDFVLPPLTLAAMKRYHGDDLGSFLGTGTGKNPECKLEYQNCRRGLQCRPFQSNSATA